MFSEPVNGNKSFAMPWSGMLRTFSFPEGKRCCIRESWSFLTLQGNSFQDVNHPGKQKPAEETVFKIRLVGNFSKHIRLDAREDIRVAVIRRANIPVSAAGRERTFEESLVEGFRKKRDGIVLPAFHIEPWLQFRDGKNAVRHFYESVRETFRGSGVTDIPVVPHGELFKKSSDILSA